jgi:diguanylate cyclase
LKSHSESLSRFALEDPLTGLANRRRLEAHLAAAHAKARSSGWPLCAAMLDLDHFKQVNDGFSHAIGDRVLQQLAALMVRHFRPVDLSSRLGGEEFVVVIDRVDLAQAAASCERLRVAVEEFDWSGIAQGLKVTTSIGLADLATVPDVAAGMDLVDGLLYQAKGRGRNCLVRQDIRVET